MEFLKRVLMFMDVVSIAVASITFVLGAIALVLLDRAGIQLMPRWLRCFTNAAKIGQDVVLRGAKIFRVLLRRENVLAGIGVTLMFAPGWAPVMSIGLYGWRADLVGSVIASLFLIPVGVFILLLPLIWYGGNSHTTPAATPAT